MALLYVENVGTLFDFYTDEKDQTGLTNAERIMILGQGYDEFRNIVSDYDSHFFSARTTIAVSGTSYDLADAANPVRVMGNNPTTTRLSRLIKVAAVDASGNFEYYFEPAASWEELEQRSCLYFLAGTTIYFSETVASAVRLEYLPTAAATVWVVGNLTAGTNAWIDELVEYHDIVALLACLHYAVPDVERNAALEPLLQKRLNDLYAYLTRGRNPGAHDHMVFVA